MSRIKKHLKNVHAFKNVNKKFYYFKIMNFFSMDNVDDAKKLLTHLNNTQIHKIKSRSLLDVVLKNRLHRKSEFARIRPF